MRLYLYRDGQQRILLARAQSSSVLVHASERPDGKDLRGATEQMANPLRRVQAAGALSKLLPLAGRITVLYESVCSTCTCASQQCLIPCTVQHSAPINAK